MGGATDWTTSESPPDIRQVIASPGSSTELQPWEACSQIVVRFFRDLNLGDTQSKVHP